MGGTWDCVRKVVNTLVVGAAVGMQAFPGSSLGAYFFMNLFFFYRAFCLEFSFSVGVLGLGFIGSLGRRSKSWGGHSLPPSSLVQTGEISTWTARKL